MKQAESERLRYPARAMEQATVKRVDIGRRLVPALLARDMSQTLAFYENLGFRVTGCYPHRSTATWAEVTRDSVVLQFHTDPPHGTPPEPICSGTFYIFPENVTALA